MVNDKTLCKNCNKETSSLRKWKSDYCIYCGEKKEVVNKDGR